MELPRRSSSAGPRRGSAWRAAKDGGRWPSHQAASRKHVPGADINGSAGNGIARQLGNVRAAPITGYAWPARPQRTHPTGIVLDPFGGTGTTALVASVYGRTGISMDRCADYCRLAAWRTPDPGERCRVIGAPKPPPVAEGQAALFA